MDLNENLAYAKMQDEQKRGYEQCQQAHASAFRLLQCANGKQISTRESLMHRLRRANEGHDNLNKALRILEAHPEFEDFMWLIRSGVI